MVIIRYNGQHDQSNDTYDQTKTHFQYHIHKATAENLNNGRYDKHPANATGDYASFEEALTAFLPAIGLRAEDISAHFPGVGVLVGAVAGSVFALVLAALGSTRTVAAARRT